MFNRILQFFCRSRCKSRGQVKQDVQVMGGRGWTSYRPSMSSESLARGIREAEIFVEVCYRRFGHNETDAPEPPDLECYSSRCSIRHSTYVTSYS